MGRMMARTDDINAKIGRNDPCPCGSGRKYKQCHGTETTDSGVGELFTLHAFQKRAVESNARFTWNNWSRQVGKSFAFSLRRIIRGLARGRNQLFLSAGERQSRELMLKAAEHLRRLKRGFDQAERTEVFEDLKLNVLEITVHGSIRVIGLPANPLTARGFTGDVLLDEFAMHGPLDREIWAAAYGSVTRGRGELDVCSTPKGRQNHFYRLLTNKIFEHSTVTILDAVAQGLDEDVEELRGGLYDEELWRQEYLCEFVDEATAFLTYELIGRAEDPTLSRDLDLDALRQHKGDVCIGVDIGHSRHPTVIWVFDKIGDRLVHLGIVELLGQKFRAQYALLSEILRCKCVRRCCIDKSGLGEQMAEDAVEDFGEHKVEPIQFTLPMKETLAGDLLIKMQDQLARIPVCDKIRNDLHSIQRSVTQVGHARYMAPLGKDEHADRFWSLALAVHAASAPAGKIEYIMGPPLKCAFERGGSF